MISPFEKTLEKIPALCEKALYEQGRLDSQILAIAGKPDTIQDEVLKHQVTVMLWHSRELKAYLNMIIKAVNHG